jgi:DNA-binding response OmpR family regulator
MKILIIEDEKKIVQFLKQGLKSEGFAVETSFDGEDGLFKATEDQYDLIILDLKLPKMDGLTVCKNIRQSGKTMPILMLTAKDEVEDRILGLDSGADDYMTKPFSFSELLARIRALRRRHQIGSTSRLLTIADLVINLDTYEVKRQDKELKLSTTEFKLLQFLMENTHRVLSKTVILEYVWEMDFSPESNIVEVYINYLREKIDKGFPQPLIKTIRGIGYRLCV